MEQLDQWQQEYLDKAERLKDELINAGFMACRVEKGEDRTDFRVVYFDGTKDYYITRDFTGHVNVAPVEWPVYQNLSGHTRGEVYTKYKGQNVKVITAKKLQAKIDALNAYHAEMEKLNNAAENKKIAFIERVREFESKGYNVQWSHDGDNISGGRIVRNGIEFQFEFLSDGYISQKTQVHYSSNNSLEAFEYLSNNQYHE